MPRRRPSAPAREKPLRANEAILSALKTSRSYLVAAIENDRTRYGGPPFGERRIYLTSWVLPPLEAAIEAMEGGQPVPDWAQSPV